MKKAILFSILTILILSNLNAQKIISSVAKPTSTSLRFPDKCVGKWSGMMQIYYQGIVRDSVKVEFTVSAIDSKSWVWKTDYLSEKTPMTKDYILKTKENAPNIFVLDEGDGIELMDYAFGNKLYSFFETEGIYLSSTYEIRDEQLIFEVTSGKKLEKTQSAITNYSVDAIQRVVLKRM